MIEFAKKKLLKVESERDKAENPKVWVPKVPPPGNSKKQLQKTVQCSKNSDNNVKEMLMQSISKTINRFCKSNEIDKFAIAQLDLLKSTDDKCLGAVIVCLCGEKVKVYTAASIKNDSISWVTSNMLKHLSKCHSPRVEITTNTNKEESQKITNFMSVSKSNPVIIEIIDSVEQTNSDTALEGPIDLKSAEFVYESLTESGNDSGNMS